MKKLYLIPLLFALCSCETNNTSTSTSNNSSNSSATTSQNSSTSSSSSNTSVDKYVTVLNRDLECILNEDKTGFIIYKYLNSENYIRLPETFSGLFSYTYENEDRGLVLDIYSGDKKYADDVLTLPIVGIMDHAFQSSGGVKDVYFPDSYVEFNHDAFTGCTTIQNYFVNETHPLYNSVDGVLYTKDGSSLFAYPLGRRETYSVIDGTKTLLKGSFKTANVTEVILPESLENIEEYAFYMAKRLKTINIPSKIIEIKESTFDTCSELKTINFAEGLKTIGYRAFWQCENIIELNFPSTLKEIGTSAFEGLGSRANGIKDLVFSEGLETIGDFAFAYNEYIETITFPSTLKTIGKYAFMQNYALKEVNLAEGIIELQEGAFFYNTNIRKVNIPSTLQTIGFNCFASSEFSSLCNGIEEFNVSPDSNYFKNVDGVVYSKDGKKLVIAPSGIEFSNGHYTVLDGVEEINDHAFYNCGSLKSITLPSSLKKIGKAPFFLTKLSSINYLGSVEEFKLIEVTDEIFSSDITTDVVVVKWYQTSDYYGVTTITCNDGTLSLI